MNNPNPNTYALVHGAWHGSWCWEFISERLEKAGQRVVTVDLPIDNPTKTFDDYADIVINSLSKIKDDGNIILLGHSRGGNVIPRVAAKIAVKQLIYLCAAFEPATIGRRVIEEESDMPFRYFQDFTDGIEYIDDEMTTYNQGVAKKVFYYDCPEDTAEWAAKQLRSQRRSSNEPDLPGWPDIQQTSIVCIDDQVINPEWSKYVTKNWLNALLIEMPGGHSPFLSRPKELAELVLSITT